MSFGLGCYGVPNSTVEVNGTLYNVSAFSIDVYQCEEYQVYFDYYTNIKCSLPINESIVVEWDFSCVDLGVPYSFSFVCWSI